LDKGNFFFSNVSCVCDTLLFVLLRFLILLSNSLCVCFRCKFSTILTLLALCSLLILLFYFLYVGSSSFFRIIFSHQYHLLIYNFSRFLNFIYTYISE